MNRFPINRILIPVDFSSTSHKVFHHVKWLALQFNAEVILMHVNEELPYTGVFPFLEAADLSSFHKNYEAAATQKLQEMATELQEAGIKKVNTEYVDGRVADVVREYVKSENIDMVAMGTHGTRGFAGYLIGSNAYKVASTIDCPILTVHDESAYAPYKNIVTTLDDSAASRSKFPYLADLAAKLNASVEILYPQVDQSDVEENIQNYF